jgi:PAS domain S-box-containing protein
LQDKTQKLPEDELIDLRLRAEAVIHDKAIDFPDVSTLPTKELQSLVHELRVHQIELAIQNDEIKRVQLALEASRDEFEDLYDFSPVGYFTLTEKGLIIQANLTGANLLGKARPKLINMRFGHFVDPESEAQLYQHFLSVIKQGHKQACDLTLKRDDGSSFYARLESIRIDAPAEQSDVSDGAYVVRLAVSDIAERKRSEEQIKLNETRLQSLYEISQFRAKTIQHFLDFTLDHAIRLTGSKVGYIYYYDADKRQFILNTWSKDVMKQCEVVEPQTVYELDKTGIWGEAVRQKTAIIINDFQAFNPLRKGYPSGHVELFKFMTTPIFQDDKIVAVVGVANKKSDYDDSDVRQVSLLMDSVWRMIDRRQAAEREQLLSTAVEQAAESVIITDASGIIQYTNPVAETISGYSSDELIGRTANILKSGKQDDFFYKALWETINAGRIWSGRFINKKKDGTEYQEDASISPVYDKSGKLTNFVAVKRDVTKEIELQEQLFHAQKLESLGVMAGAIAHDFNNLLMATLGNLELALTDRNLESKTRMAIENAIQASERSAALSHQMLVYSGSAFYTPKDLDLGEQADKLANKNKDLLKSAIPRTTTLHFEINEGLPLIRGDEDQIQRLITNLVLNASESIGDNTGEVNLTTGVIDCDDAYLSGSRLQEKPSPGGFVFLEVTDTGCGMDVATQRKLFDPFFSTKFWGRGLGMAEVMGIVKGHHGAIMVESEVGKGTRIRVLFPAAEGSAPSITSR